MTNKDFLKTLSLEKTRLEHELTTATEKADDLDDMETLAWTAVVTMSHAPIHAPEEEYTREQCEAIYDAYEQAMRASEEQADYVEEIENAIEKIKSLMEMYED